LEGGRPLEGRIVEIRFWMGLEKKISGASVQVSGRSQ
jgi:hypothetical protein